jgi:hypothetical protein
MSRGHSTGVVGWRRRAGRAVERQDGKGEMGKLPAAALCESCVCPNCSHKVTNMAGVPCSEKSCPECGTRMTRG